MVISIRRISLGAGYRYLMESVAVGDGARGRPPDLVAYYAESGTPPGVFLGAGLGDVSLEKGKEVSEEHLFRMLGLLAHPVTREPLGSVPKRIVTPVRPPVAGFDLTFSPSKSISVAWALADTATKQAIFDCHRKAIEIVLTYAEEEVFHSRSGRGGVVEEDITGVIAAAFTHWDSRSGDPQLHDHVVILNRARSVSDGKWRTIDSRGLFKAVVMLSEMHQGVLADLLTARLGWGWESRGRRHSERRRIEVDGVAEALMGEFSQRSADIESRMAELLAGFIANRGRRPTATEAIRLRQQATIETRPAKSYRSLADLTASWRSRAVPFVGGRPDAWVASLAGRNDLPLLRSSDLAEPILADLARVALTRVGERRATFSRFNVAAEVHRQLQGVRFASPAERLHTVDRAVSISLGEALLLTPPPLHHTPAFFRRADGSSRFRSRGAEVYTTETIVEAEARLLDAGRRLGAPAAEGHPSAVSGRLLDVLVGPAGTGKTTSMRGLRAAWEATFGPGSVVGLAPSAAAAEVLAEELGIETENTAKWLHEHRHGRWPLRESQLVIVDEASLAGTFALAELVGAAADVGAKVLLVGDDAQLSAVEAGGMFASLVADRDGLAPSLTSVHRFTSEWEKGASLLLRRGDPAAVAAYEGHGRIVEGERESLLDAAYQAWKADIEAGRSSLMIAPDTATVSELNRRARADLVADGSVTASGVNLAGGGAAGVGDLVITRQNDRRLLAGRRWVRNGDRWRVTRVGRDGSLTVSHGRSTVTLPTRYVAQHVELGYAATAHRSQGRTVDTAHAIVSPTTTREVLYVAATRGRQANHLYVDTRYDPDPQTGHDRAIHPQTARDVLIAVLAREGADISAHEAMRRAHEEAESIPRLAAEYQTIAAVAQADRWITVLSGSGLNAVQLEAVRASEAFGPLTAALRSAEATGLDVVRALPALVGQRTLVGVDDVAAVLHHRVESWAVERSPAGGSYVAGVLPRAERVSDPDMARGLAERESAIERLSAHVAAQARGWVNRLGRPPVEPHAQRDWFQAIAVVAAYRDRWGLVADLEPVGSGETVSCQEQYDQRRRALAAAQRAIDLSRGPLSGTLGAHAARSQIGQSRGVER